MMAECNAAKFAPKKQFQMSAAKFHQKPVADLKSHLGFWLRFVSNHVSHAFNLRLADSGVTAAEWVVLREMFDAELRKMFDGTTTAPSEIAATIGMTRGAVSRLIDRLVNKKLARRHESGKDHRFQEVGLTPAGLQLVPRLAAIADEHDRQFFSSLSARERKKLLQMLKKLAGVNKLTKLPVE
jgi:DNA-binding MarR family transcriptional regulator